MELERIRRDLIAESEAIATGIVKHWNDVGAGEPWLQLPEDVGTDYLPELIENLAAATLDPGATRDEVRELLDAGCRHGADRRDEGMAEDLLFREQHLLRRALWDLLRKRYGEEGTPLTAMMRLDAGIAAGVRASLYGFHRGVPDASDDAWDVEAALIMDDYPHVE